MNPATGAAQPTAPPRLSDLEYMFVGQMFACLCPHQKLVEAVVSIVFLPESSAAPQVIQCLRRPDGIHGEAASPCLHQHHL